MTSKTAQKTGTWRHARNVAWRKVSGEAVILDVDTAVYYSLNGVGLRMWELLGEGRGSDEAAGVLAAEFDAAPERIRKDYEDLAKRLRKEGLLSPA